LREGTREREGKKRKTFKSDETHMPVEEVGALNLATLELEAETAEGQGG
jgi:hypothetical protein